MDFQVPTEPNPAQVNFPAKYLQKPLPRQLQGHSQAIPFEIQRMRSLQQ